MLAFYRKYVIAVCAISVGVPVVVSTIWPLVTGQIMAASIPGLATLIVLLFGALVISSRFFGAKADAETERLFDLYNAQCDPRAFVDEAAQVAAYASARVGELSSWFLSYFGQALLDVGEASRAEDIAQAQLEGMQRCRTASEQAAVAVNMVPLLAKLREPADVLPLVSQGLELLGSADDFASNQRRDYLRLQRDYLTARAEGDRETVVRMCQDVRANEDQPLRVRVERSWDEAQVHFAAGEASLERACLEFVVENGNKLALVGPARVRLAAIS